MDGAEAPTQQRFKQQQQQYPLSQVITRGQHRTPRQHARSLAANLYALYECYSSKITIFLYNYYY